MIYRIGGYLIQFLFLAVMYTLIQPASPLSTTVRSGSAAEVADAWDSYTPAMLRKPKHPSLNLPTTATVPSRKKLLF